MDNVELLTKTFEIAEIAIDDGGIKDADDAEKFVAGVFDGMKMGLILHEDPNLVPTEVYGNIEVMDMNNPDYLRGALAGVLAVPRIVEIMKVQEG